MKVIVVGGPSWTLLNPHCEKYIKTREPEALHSEKKSELNAPYDWLLDQSQLSWPYDSHPFKLFAMAINVRKRDQIGQMDAKAENLLV